MKADFGQISFRPVTSDDLTLLADWMEQDHWKKWWGDPKSEIDDIRNMIEGRDTTRPFLFLVDGKETGYIQYWFVGHHQNASWIDGYPWLGELPRDAIGVDLSIGMSENLGRGIGSAVLTRFAEQLIGFGYETIIIDPDPTNERAIGAYTNAGFRTIPHLKGKTDDVLLMQFETNKYELNQ